MNLFDLRFFVDYVFANCRIVLLRFHLLGMELLVFRSRVVVSGAGT